jgi:hypothetical protein
MFKNRCCFFSKLICSCQLSASSLACSLSLPLFLSFFLSLNKVQIKDALFAEFNTLSVVYSKVQRHFIAPDKRPRDHVGITSSSSSSSSVAAGAVAAAGVVVDGGQSALLGNGDATSLVGVEGSSSSVGGAGTSDGSLGGGGLTDVSASPYGAPVDLLGGGGGGLMGSGVDLLGGLGGGGGDGGGDGGSSTPTAEAVAAATATATAATATLTMQLSPSAELSGERFQALWSEWGEGPFAAQSSGVAMASANANASDNHSSVLLLSVTAEAMDAWLSASQNIFTMASGDLPDHAIKLFLYVGAVGVIVAVVGQGSVPCFFKNAESAVFNCSLSLSMPACFFVCLLHSVA